MARPMGVMSDAYAAQLAQGALTADPAQQAILPVFDRILDDLARPPARTGLFRRRVASPPVRGLYLWGGVGRGKSMLMDLFHEVAPEPRKRRVHFHAFMQEIHEVLHQARKSGVEDAILPVADAVIAQTRLLCFDEMQITDITDAMIVGRLFQRLFEAGVVIVTTSNRVPDDLYKDGLNRALFLPFIALIKDRLEVVELASPTDWRQDRLAGEARYFEPADDHARAQMDAIWSDLSGAAPAPLTLQVKGREVVVPQFSNGVGRVGFADLCAKPLGPADYLALAQAVRVLMMDDIPQLSRSNANEAKRFVTLIDALYEARVQFICSAAAAPEALYQAGDGAFEFARTASRLREMQSADWP